jgi:hypothetical protein
VDVRYDAVDLTINQTTIDGFMLQHVHITSPQDHGVRARGKGQEINSQTPSGGGWTKVAVNGRFKGGVMVEGKSKGGGVVVKGKFKREGGRGAGVVKVKLIFLV